MAESFDAWRIMPRIMLIAYGILVMHLYLWYKSIPTYVQEKCDAAVLQIFLNNDTPIDDAKRIACTVQDVVGGPTPAQTTLVTTIIGLSSIIFGFYTASGRRWERGMPDDVREQNRGNPVLPIPPLPIPPLPPLGKRDGKGAEQQSETQTTQTTQVTQVTMGPNGPIS